MGNNILIIWRVARFLCDSWASCTVYVLYRFNEQELQGHNWKWQACTL